MNQNQAVSSIMATDLTVVGPSDKVKDIQAIFEQNDLHHIPVLSQGNLVGIISKADISKLYYYMSKNTTGKTLTEKEYDSLTADDIMTVFPIKLDPEDTIGLAANIFLANKFHALPVVEDGTLLGIVTTHAVLEYAFVSADVEISYKN